MEFRVTRSKAATIIIGILYAILGVIVLLNPWDATEVLTLVTGWVLLISGIVSLVGAFSSKSVMLSSLNLYWGIFGTLLGILIVMNPAFFVAWIFILLGIFIMMAGFSMIFTANAIRVAGGPHAGAQLLLAILTVVFGALVIVSPFAMVELTVLFCGVALVYTGIVSVIDGIRMES